MLHVTRNATFERIQSPPDAPWPTHVLADCEPVAPEPEPRRHDLAIVCLAAVFLFALGFVVAWWELPV